ncbi:MAG: isomerase [Salinisphaeraceae bacterium]|nr:isomerase [Salinisphaeraceae bacterium]
MTDGSISLFKVDAFTRVLFRGNPAAVCPLRDWLPDSQLQSIAAENNLSETAFFRPQAPGYALRWFTPTHEVRLCGHATLATAFVLWNCLGETAEELQFSTRESGVLRVSRQGDTLWLDLPVQAIEPAECPADVAGALGAVILDCRRGPNWLLRVEDEAALRGLTPDLRALAAHPDRGFIVTAPADDPGVDFVSRYFAPNFGVDEDPVTGSAHCMLTPYWAERLGKSELAARQCSARGGDLRCRLLGDRVQVGGQARLYLTGEILLP